MELGVWMDLKKAWSRNGEDAIDRMNVLGTENRGTISPVHRLVQLPLCRALDYL